MCTGRRHFTASGNIVADLQALQTHEPIRPRSLNPSLDPDLEVIILKCLRTSPDERYRSVSALLSDLQSFRRGGSITARPVTSLELAKKIFRRNRTASYITMAATALILFLIAGSFWSLSDRLAKERKARTEAERMRELAESAASAQLIASQKANQMEAAQNTVRGTADSESIDLGLGTGITQYLRPKEGNVFHVIAFNQNYALLRIKEISGRRISYDWKTPEGLEGSGTLDLAENPKSIDLPGIKVAWNNYLEAMEFYPEKGALVLANADGPGSAPWEVAFSKKDASALTSQNSQNTYISYLRTPLTDLPLEDLLQKANSQDKVAQIELGHRYKSGRDVDRNNDLAAVWYQKASRQGSPEADMCIARLNWLGRLNIEPASWENAFMVFERLASDGSGPSQHYTGLCYLNGRGTKVDYSKAGYWFAKSVENTTRNTYKGASLWELGKMHLEGLGVSKNPSKARELINQAAELDHAEAKEWLGTSEGNPSAGS